ncbi:maleylpyruvate isomerase N-terminal domain-containing protein [Agromyces sp. SYSU T00194]|uniref:maleylpyruvate isomerase N-terminal domain-containing protein n=1 Tax=Agromyces chitinivorans TaxID=3158560 RepID=UPI003397B412
MSGILRLAIEPDAAPAFARAVRTMSEEFAAEAGAIDPTAGVASATWPTAASMVDHLGQIQRWAAEVVRTGRQADRAAHARPEASDPIAWFAEGATALADTLDATDPARPCWTFRGEGPTAFWSRRMAHEARKHLWDLRTAGTASPPAPDVGGPAMLADGIDELYAVFLARTLASTGLDPLPGTLVLRSTDVPAAWTIAPDWSVTRHPTADATAIGEPVDDAPDDPTVLRAALGDLLLFVWERAKPSSLPGRFRVLGDPATIDAYAASPVHP